MRHRTSALAAAGAIAVLASGCGSAAGVRAAPSGPAGGTDISAACGDVVLDLSGKDIPREVCLSVGGTLRLRSGARPAPAADESGEALKEISPGVYRGAAEGNATLSGSRRACPDQPGRVSCLVLVPWSVTVDVR